MTKTTVNVEMYANEFHTIYKEDDRTLVLEMQLKCDYGLSPVSNPVFK